MTTPQISIIDNLASVVFDTFGADAYEMFLRVKRLPESQLEYDYERDRYTVTTPARFARLLGADVPAQEVTPLPLAGYLFDDQRAIVRAALDAKRFAVWSDCGLGKTAVQLEYARHVAHLTGGRVLIVTLNEIVSQTVEEAARFYGDELPITRLETRAEMRRWCREGYRGKPAGEFWRESKDGDPVGFELYRRHYSAKKNPRPKIKQFVGPGEKLVLISRGDDALFAWRKFIDDSGQQGVNCAVFRNESSRWNSEMIREAMEFAWARWPGARLYTYVDPQAIRSTNPGYCFLQAGWRRCGKAKAGQVILEVQAPRVAITNYEKFNPDADGQIIPELRHLAGLVLDESSRLKTGGGKQKWALIKSSKGIPYKLSCTATPAPNDMMEFASQASFLERMRDEGEIIWTFFRRDPRTQEWTVKRHARKAFFEFLAGWSIYMRDPRAYGWRRDFAPPPEPEFFEHKVEITPEQVEAARAFNVDAKGQARLFSGDSLGVVGRGKLSQIAKGFVYDGKRAVHVRSNKPAFVVDLIKREVERGLQVLVWTVFDEETAILAQMLNRTDVTFDALSGSTKKEDRLLILEDFRKGETQVLVSKASLLGYGMNFQMCGSMIFSGWNDSYEQMYQAVRRAYRYGQTRSVRVHVPFVAELEGAVLENVRKKQAHFEEAISEMERAYVNAQKSLKLLEGE